MKKEMDTMIQNAYIEELLNLPDAPADVQAIQDKTFAKLGLEEKAAPQLKVTGKKRKRGLLRTIGLTAALVLLSGTLVFATGSLIYSLTGGEIEYFEREDSTGYYDSIQPDLETFSVPVGETVSASGVDITLDSIAVDDNFLTAFLTVKYPGEIDMDSLFEDGDPDWSNALMVAPWFEMLINGKAVDAGYQPLDNIDPYVAGSNELRVMLHQVLPETVPDEFHLDIRTGGEQGYVYSPVDSGQIIEGRWDFSLDIDKSVASPYTLSAVPGEYRFTLDGEQVVLDLAKLSFSPLGAVISENGHWNGVDPNYDEGYITAESLYIETDTGAVLNTWWNNAVSSGSEYYALELMGDTQNATSVSLTPIVIDWEAYQAAYESGEAMRMIDVNDCVGQRVETSDLGGFVIEDYRVEGSRISFELAPYGHANYNVELIPEDDHVTLRGGRSGLIHQQVDRATGVLTFSIDYYAATPEELSEITEFHYYYSAGYSLDEGQTLKLELS